MKFKMIIFNVLLFFLTLTGIFAISRYDRSNYQQTLNHNQLSNNALVFKSQKKQSIKKTIQKLDQLHLDNYQIQFNVSDDIAYLYAKGDFKDAPLVSGRYFNINDFTSKVPVVVVGQEIQSQLYQPTKQAYLKTKSGRYLSVIGITGISKKSTLNQQILVSASPEYVYNNPSIKNIDIIIDGPQVRYHLSDIKKILGVKKYTYLVANNRPITGSTWLKNHFLIFLGMLMIVLLSMGLVYLYASILLSYQGLNTITKSVYRRYQIGELLSFIAQTASMLLLAYLLGKWWFYISLPALLMIELIVFELILIIYFSYLLKKGVKA